MDGVEPATFETAEGSIRVWPALSVRFSRLAAHTIFDMFFPAATAPVKTRHAAVSADWRSGVN